MKINITGLVLAGSVWLAAIVLAWPANHPYNALGVLGAHAVLVLGLDAAGPGRRTGTGRARGGL